MDFQQYLPHFITWLAAVLVFGGTMLRTYVFVKKFKDDEREKEQARNLKLHDIERDLRRHEGDDARAFKDVSDAMARIASSSERRDQTLQDQIHKIEENTTGIRSSLDVLIGRMESKS